MMWQDSFYHNLSEEELTRVFEYNFDHPGEDAFNVLDRYDGFISQHFINNYLAIQIVCKLYLFILLLRYLFVYN